MTTITKTGLKKMKVEEIQNLMKTAGVVFSTNAKKEDLINLALIQKEQIEDFYNQVEDENQNTEEVNEMNVNEENVVNVEEVNPIDTATSFGDDYKNGFEEETAMHQAINESIDACEDLDELSEIANHHGVALEENEFNSLAIYKHDLKKLIGTDYLVEDAKIEFGNKEVNVPGEVADRIEEIVKDVENKKSSGKRGGRGKKIIINKNGEYFGEEPTIKSCAQRFKDLFELKAMPFNHIMKSTRSEGQEPWIIGEDTYTFVFENKDDILTPKQKTQKSVKDDAVEDKFEEIIDEEQKEFIELIAEELQ